MSALILKMSERFSDVQNWDENENSTYKPTVVLSQEENVRRVAQEARREHSSFSYAATAGPSANRIARSTRYA